jgi:ubiquinone/menaquinone biosynthesis C-methylase UbiE
MQSTRRPTVSTTDEASEAASATPSKEEIWATYALSYDAVLPSLDFYREVVERHVDALAAEDVGTIIDIGAGTGSVAIPLLLRGRRVTCVDSSQAMLERLQQKVPAEANDRVAVALCNAENLSAWPDASFDGVNILLALFAMADQRAAFAHAMRVLRPGGVFVATEPKRCFDMKSLLAHAEQWLRSQGLYERLHEHWQRVFAVNQIIDPGQRLPAIAIEDICSLLGGCGFQIHSVRDSHHGNCATVIARKGVTGDGANDE